MGSFTQLNYHIVFATKYRRPLIKDAIQERLYEYIGGIVRNEKGSLLEIGGVADHVHLLVRLSPTIAIATVVQAIKGSSSHWLNSLDGFVSSIIL